MLHNTIVLEALVRFTLRIENQNRWDNVAVDALSQFTLKLDAKTVKSVWMESPWE